MKSLNEVRDELAEYYGDSQNDGKSEQQIFCEGFGAALSHLSAGAGELSREEIEWLTAEVRERYNTGFDEETNAVNLALWAYRKRFDQDRARIGAAIAAGKQLAAEGCAGRELELTARCEKAEQALEYERDAKDAFKAAMVELEARAEQAERERDEQAHRLMRDMGIHVANIEKLQAKLAAAEVERDKAKADHAYRYNLCDQLTQHNHKLEQRVKELEAMLEGVKFV